MERYNGLLQTDAYNVPADEGSIARFELSEAQACAADDDAIVASGSAYSSKSAELTPDEDFAGMPWARNVTVKAGGTAASIKAVKPIVYGTDIDGMPLSEELPAFTADTAGTVAGSKAFGSVEKIVIPAMDGSGVTIKVGFGDLYGLPYKLTAKPLALGSVDDVQEDVILAVDADELAGNTFTFASAPAGEKVQIALIL